MKESGNYPQGAEFDSNAPWNQTEKDPIETEVFVSLCISKTFKIRVDDYEATEIKDEDGSSLKFDFSNCDFKKALLEQVVLPTEAYAGYNNKLREDLEGWQIDDLEVIKE